VSSRALVGRQEPSSASRTADGIEQLRHDGARALLLEGAVLYQVVEELACGDTGRYGEIRGDAGRCGEIRGDMVGWSRSSFGEMWGDVGRRGEMWGDQVIKELTALDELHQQTELGLRLEDVVEADDVRVVQRLEDPRLRYGEIWGDMGRYGEIWGDMGRLEDPRLEQRARSGYLTARSCSSTIPLLRDDRVQSRVISRTLAPQRA